MKYETEQLVNKVCEHLPDGYELCLFMENGAAWLEMYNNYTPIELGDPTDKSLVDQLNDALCIANGWYNEIRIV
jgi:hypothetical protein